MQRELPGELLPLAKRYAEKLNTSLPLVFLSAFHQFLYAYTDLDIPLFIPASGRVRPELANMLGQFTIPIIFRPGCTAFDEAIHAAEQTMRVDFSKMRELYEAADRELSLCDVSPARFLYVREHSLPFPLIRLDPRLSFFPLSLLLTETGERIWATLQFSDRFIDSKGGDLFIDFFSQFLLAKLSGITLHPSKKWHYPVRRKNKKSFNASNASTFTKQTIQTGADSHNSQRTQSIHLTVEDRITRVFSDVLGRPCGRDDDFFRMGGSSLQAARILILLRKEENLSFSFADLIYCPSPARLARKIDNVSSLCVKINSSTQATPLFIIHDQGGEIHGIVRLVSRLQYAGPIFAIRASGLVKNVAFDRSIHAMAKRYAAEIMQTQKGSCFIGGMCTGATIALETASILQKNGRTVEKLLLLRPTPPLSLAKKTHYFKPIFRYFRSLTDFLSLISKPFYKLFIFVNLYLGAQAGQRRVWSFFAKDLKNHSPLPFPGPAALIMSEEKLRTFPEYVKEWGYLVQGNLEVFSVPGSHYTMLQHPALDNFAEKLKLAIETKVKLS